MAARDRAQERMREVGSSRRREESANCTPALKRSGAERRLPTLIRLEVLFLLSASKEHRRGRKATTQGRREQPQRLGWIRPAPSPSDKQGATRAGPGRGYL